MGKLQKVRESPGTKLMMEPGSVEYGKDAHREKVKHSLIRPDRPKGTKVSNMIYVRI